ncbi:MAG: ribosome maturation factor RimM [Myxococcota bacterium]
MEVGRVLRSSGRDGALLVELYGEDVSNLLDAERVRLEGSPGEIPFRIRSVRAASAGALGARARLWLEGLADLERAAAWRGARVSLPEAALKPLPQGEFYWRQIIGLRARLADGRHVGRVEEIWPTPANDVLVVREGDRQYLIPAVPDLLLRIDLGAGEIWLDPPGGLLEQEA